MAASIRERVVLAESKDLLTAYKKERGKYYCPACGGHNLSFHKDGRWNCWNDPSRYHRLEIVRTLFPTSEYHSSSNPPIDIPRPEEDLALYDYLPQISSSIEIRYPKIERRPVITTRGNTTSYYYSHSQRIDRRDYKSHKSFCSKHSIDTGWIRGAGNDPWEPYGLAEITCDPSTLNLVLIVEGQKSVQIGFDRQIPTICLQAGDYSDLTTVDKLEKIVSKLNPCLLAILPDNDLSGKLKAAKILVNCIKLQIPAVLFNPADLGYERSGDDLEQLTYFDRDYAIWCIHRLFNR